MLRFTAPALVAFGVAGVVLVGEAQSPYQTPRTPWGDPDLEGRWPSTTVSGVPLQRPPAFGTRNELTDTEFADRVAQLANQAVQDQADFDFERPSVPFGQVGGGQSPPPHWLERSTPQRQVSLLVDPPNGRLPALTPEAQKRAAGRNAGAPPASYTDFTLYERCITRGVVGSFLPGNYGNGNEIVQAPGYVTILNEMVHEARVVPLDGRPHVAAGLRNYMGHSRGHWDGDTLVIETRHFVDRLGVGMNGTGASDALTITERFRRTSSTSMSYAVTVDDPKTWTAPFTLQYTLGRDDKYGMFEYACHEGNYAVQNVLRAARAAEREATGASPR